jgi:hypothetical protein
MLFEQCYSKRIIERRNEILSQDSALEPLSAYNRAVHIELECFKDTNLQELEELENAIVAIKAAANVEFDHQSPVMDPGMIAIFIIRSKVV